LSNPAHALANLQKHDQHLAAMSDDKRAEAVEQERWAKALHRAEGGKIVDSERILKKAVKRVEKNKSKSGKEWYVHPFNLLLCPKLTVQGGQKETAVRRTSCGHQEAQ
jgi:hypothetical protein